VKFLASVKVRIFLTAWVVFAAHFATNVVREHYPAFSIAEHLTFRVDEYQGLHADIFVHTDGHSYIGNNVAVSVLAAVPLALFDPILDALEEYRLRQLASETGLPPAEYQTDKPNRRAFFQLARERGLDLRLGAAAVVTSVFLMAPLSALTVVLMFHLLALRGVAERRAIWLALLLAFGTPVFFRTAHLNHNMFLMYAVFAAFFLLWVRPEHEAPASLVHRMGAGFLAGFTLAADYIGVITLFALFAYLVLARRRTADWPTALRESVPFVLASIPPVLFLLYSQWAMFGNPFLPGQYWMPEVNYTDRGWRGFSWPAADLFWLNLFSPSYGMYTFGPLLLLGLVPARWYPESQWILPRMERRFVFWTFLAMLTFSAANQYSRMQFNSGFRYLIPVVPLVFLAATDHLARMPARWLGVLTAVVGVHTWVVTVFRESVIVSWQLFLTEGVTLPWLSVLRRTVLSDVPALSSPLVPLAIVGLLGGFIAAIWSVGARGARTAPDRPRGAGLSPDARALS